MATSAAAIVKEYLQKYIITNELKLKQCRYEDRVLAKSILSNSYNIIHKMDDLITSNQGNDFTAIKDYLRHEVSSIRQEQRNRTSLLHWLVAKPPLPSDFSKCIHNAWLDLHVFEKSYKPSSPDKQARSYSL